MKALTYDKTTDEFQVSDLPVPSPAAGEVRVKVAAAGLNPVDAKIHLWHGAVPTMDNTWVPGLDVSGVIDAVGEGVTQWNVGDAVLYHGDMFKPHGGFAEYAIVEAATLTPHPKLDAESAAATPCAGWTAWRALVDKLRISERKSILILGASGGVGSFAIQIAKYFGVPTIIASCSAKNADYVKQLGATHTIDYKSEDVVKAAKAITDGWGVEVALDAVGADNDIIAANALCFEGEMLELVSTVRPKEYHDVFMKGLSFHQLALGAAHGNGPKAKADLVIAGTSFSAVVEVNNITVPRLQTVTLDQAGQALKDIRDQRTVGKVVLKF